jgi:hypothetical protein
MMKLELTSPFGEIVLETEAGPIEKFIDSTFQEVDGLEEIDLLPLSDQALANFMGRWESL